MMSDDDQEEDNNEGKLITGIDFGGKTEEASIHFINGEDSIPDANEVIRSEIAVSLREAGILGTASVMHDGTWTCERRQLERRAREEAYPNEPRFHFSIWNRPTGFRGLYLDGRSGLWKLEQALRRRRPRHSSR